jgi:hypothetical protein
MRSAIASVGIAACLTFASLTALAPSSSAQSPSAVTTTTAVGSASLPSILLPVTKRIRKGVYKPAGMNCPKNARIKGNRSSHIFHMPGQRFYKRTKPELCFTTPAVARANHYRKSKV